MVHEEKPRNARKLAVIEELIRGNVRRMVKQTGQLPNYTRDTCEAKNNKKGKQADCVEEIDMPTTNEQHASRPQRTAAMRAKDSISK